MRVLSIKIQELWGIIVGQKQLWKSWYDIVTTFHKHTCYRLETRLTVLKDAHAIAGIGNSPKVCSEVLKGCQLRRNTAYYIGPPGDSHCMSATVKVLISPAKEIWAVLFLPYLSQASLATEPFH